MHINNLEQTDFGQNILDRINSNDPNITSIKFDQNELESDQIIDLAKALTKNTHITKIDLSGNEIDFNGIQNIAECFKENNTIKEVFLSGCQISDSFFSRKTNILMEGLLQNHTIISLDLSNNDLSQYSGIENLANYLRNNRSLTTLSLKGSNVIKLNDYGFIIEPLLLAMTNNICLTSFVSDDYSGTIIEQALQLDRNSQIFTKICNSQDYSSLDFNAEEQRAILSSPENALFLLKIAIKSISLENNPEKVSEVITQFQLRDDEFGIALLHRASYNDHAQATDLLSDLNLNQRSKLLELLDISEFRSKKSEYNTQRDNSNKPLDPEAEFRQAQEFRKLSNLRSFDSISACANEFNQSQDHIEKISI